jgi:hypothetical protein
MSFHSIMNEAVRLRTETDAKLRTDFDALPEFIQATLFASDAVLAIRELTIQARLDAAGKLKQRGTEQLRSGNLEQAAHEYKQVHD